MNTTATWSSGETKEILTLYGEGMASILRSNWENYKVCRIDKHHYLVTNSKSFDFDVDNRQEKRRLIPQYSLCHEITLDFEQKCGRCSCDKREKTGLPCVHIVALCKGKLHPQMFHVRYYKTYNSHLIHDNIALFQIFKKMRNDFKKNPTKVSLEGTFEFNAYDKNDTTYEGTTKLDKVNMTGLRKWNVERKSFDLTELRCIPDEFLVGEDLQDETDDMKGNGVDEIAMEGFMDLLTRDSRHVNQSALGINSLNGDFENVDHRVWYNKIAACITEISKLCETKKSAKPRIFGAINKLRFDLRKEVHDDLKSVGYVPDNTDSKLVSSSFNHNTSPSSRRYLMAHETQNKKFK